ncbi:MAG: DUF4097 domain-containing protein [Pyrinomonadaceae bacterium]
MTIGPKNLKYSCVVLAFIAALSAAILAHQQPPKSPSPAPTPVSTPERMRSRNMNRQPILDGVTSERSVKADGSVNINLCVRQGAVKVRGWDRSEIRVYVDNGSKFGFTIRQKSPQSGDANLVDVVPMKGAAMGGGQCIMADEVEVDAPVNATVLIKGVDATTNVDSIKRVTVETIDGTISLSNISAGINASSGIGDITVETSQGAMTLGTTTGNIIVFDAGPNEVGDAFSARTHGGTISLQMVGHRQVEVNTVSGAVAFHGTLLKGGSYSITTSNGSIRLAIPLESSSVVRASYGFGSFRSEIPIIKAEATPTGPAKSLVGVMGAGDANLRLTTHNGSVSIRKQ